MHFASFELPNNILIRCVPPSKIPFKMLLRHSEFVDVGEFVDMDKYEINIRYGTISPLSNIGSSIM